eukprot:symbB.v1.2.017569.t1/scaffold1369.1/size123032/2
MPECQRENEFRDCVKSKAAPFVLLDKQNPPMQVLVLTRSFEFWHFKASWRMPTAHSLLPSGPWISNHEGMFPSGTFTRILQGT